MDTFLEYKTRTVSEIRNLQDKNAADHSVAIIGCGPKGLYAFERLTAQLNANPIDKMIEIHLFNKTPNFGSGEIWNPDQPDFLLVNFCIGNINMWTDEKPESVAPETLSLTDWLRKKDPQTKETDYAPRGVVGEYLEDGFDQIIKNLPQNIRVKKHVGEVYDIEKIGEEFVLTIEQNGAKEKLTTRFQSVMLTTGHSSRHRSQTEKNYEQFTGKHKNLSFVPFVYPVENLAKIPPQTSVGIKGMGLTFVDAVLALTEGRGGEFEFNNKGQIQKYKPSGKEPASIYPFSRSSLPIIPRGAFFGEPNFKLRFFNYANIKELREQDPSRKPDFTDDLWNLVRQEMTYAYYRVLMKNSGFEYETPLSFADFQNDIKRFHQKFPNEKRFDVDEFLDYLKTENYSADSHKAFIEKYIEQAINEARIGEDESPWMAVVAIWREITPIFGQIYKFGGLTHESHRDFLENYFGMLCRITFGPPILSIEKILAIAKSGILKFEIGANPKVSLNETNRKFQIFSEQNGFRCEVEHLIDARIPKNKLPQNATRLYKNLLEKGLIKPFQNGDFNVGCLEISENGSVIDAKGNIQDDLSAYGTPTEGITFDNDSLSRKRNNFASIWAEKIIERINTNIGMDLNIN